MGTLRRVGEGGVVGWLLTTSITKEHGWPEDRVDRRTHEIDLVRQRLQISEEFFYELGFPSTELDKVSMSELVGKVSKVFTSFEPEEVFLPSWGYS